MSIELINPCSEEVWHTITAINQDDLNSAVERAQNAYHSWRQTPSRQRGELLYRLATLVERDFDLLAEMETKNTGLAICETKGFHVPFTISCLKYFAGWADKLHGSTVPAAEGYLCQTYREPIGVIGSILPWNFPLMLLSWKVGPALSAGNVLLVKPSPYSPMTALHLEKLALEAGIPKGVFQVLPMLDETAPYFTAHPGIDKITFTGSTSTAQKVITTAGLKPVSTELGGKSPIIVCPDADLEKTVEWCHMALFLNHGQNCCAGSRIYVHDSLYDEFVERSAELARSRRVGDPFDPEVKQGPLINKQQFETVMHYIELGLSEGARLVAGGNRIGEVGYFVEPTVFADVQDDHTIAREEIFGPVMSILKYSDDDDIIARANDSKYGLAAGVFTNDLNRAMKYSQELQAGTVWINCYNMTDPASPFGGFKQSGNGRDLSEYAFENYTETKSVVINLGE